MTDIKRRLLACALLMCMMVCVFAGLAATPAELPTCAVNWMENVPDETKLSSMSIPGTHDSCTQNVDALYLPVSGCEHRHAAQIRLPLSRHAPGARKRSGQGDARAQAQHRQMQSLRLPFSRTLTLADVLKDVYAFLDEHPSETVILCMKAENSKDDVAAVQKALYKMIDQASERWYLKNEIPSLGAVRGRIVLATRFDDKLPVGSDRCGLYFGWTDQGDRTILDDPTADSVINGRETLCVQDRYNFDVGDKITAIRTCLDSSHAANDTFFPELHLHERAAARWGTRRIRQGHQSRSLRL